jgi:YXWGXW repeat-containing protein
MRCARLGSIGLTSLALSLGATDCYWRGAGFPLAVASTAIVTAAIVSAAQPPPPRVVYVPEPRPGYAWQPGYWTRQDDQWVWVEGQWVALQPGYAWSPTHWEQTPDGEWRLVSGHWVAAQ